MPSLPRLIYERSLNVLASSLAMVAQRLPFLKNLSPFFGSATSLHFAAPLTVTFVGTQSLSGQSTTLLPANGSSDPATVMAGDDFLWAFKASSGTVRSFSVEILAGDQFVTGLPAGLSMGISSGIGYIYGQPTEPGIQFLAITGYELANMQGVFTNTYYLTLDVTAPATPFEKFLATFWSGADLENPAITGPNADPDGDGIENVLEFVLSLDPTKSGKFPATLTRDRENGSMLSYVIPLNEVAEGATVFFEESLTGNPTDWTPVASEEMQRTSDKITLTTPLGPGRKLFRLKVTL